MRLAGIDSLTAAHHFLETHFLPEWEQRFTVVARKARNAHRPLDHEQRLEEMSVRVARKVAQDFTVSWEGVRGRKSVPDFVGQQWKSKDGWMARTGCASANTTCASSTVQRRLS
jgi:hypothetical protein